MSNEVPLFGNEKPNGSPNNKQPKKIVLTVVSIAIIALVIVLALRLTSNESADEPGEVDTSSNLVQKLNQSFVVEDDIQNAFNADALGVSDQYIFYSDEHGLYRIDKDGSNRLELDTGKISNLNVYQEELYYSRADIKDDNETDRNKGHQVIRTSFDGSDKKEIDNYNCQRIRSMLVVNDVVLYEPVVYFPGEPSGTLKSEYVAASLDGSDITVFPNDNYHSKFKMRYPYTQSQLDSLLSNDYPNTVVRSARYSISDTMYFGAQSIEDPRTIKIFSISKANDVLNMIGEHAPDTSIDPPSRMILNGFAYDGESIFYTLTEKKRIGDSLESKLDLYKIDVDNNSTTFVETLYRSEGF
ncbi:DUF5050 domain-containing protein [Herbivorax sp. ANBcel31]|uniref:DUF5050 domain-containing protein n=1 Tax=Herbivorax sp. ANBcel31 TaxID=3069754 RepID=UPI0027B20331|nr:DUF5050 domain-containing protein [Herbivorax sp. ANBcel31]MDQ2086064.1 DUF5050 domain-containing protein [Herbivorax sp. ANBcel31]